MNLANEPGSWDKDFSHAYLERLYARLKRDFDLALLGDASEEDSAHDRPRAFVRHDIDVSLERAVELARKEQEWGVRSTYHVMLDSPFYDVRSERSAAAIAEIIAIGHEVGLHYDVVARKTKTVDGVTREKDIDSACKELASIIGRDVRSLSFHLPIEELIRGPLRVAGRVSGYAKELFQWYLSDSRARWREGDPIESLGMPRGKVLQILIHPIWWGETDMRPAERLREWLLGLSGRDAYEAMRAKLWDHIIFRAADP
ncbi:MAG: hypothetical protein BGO98_32990 [Myxococcales bacterium 68-20]|nr:hypothetical protein [Myxococcales bacterium]OJY18549.1 MAG: hypothetical protein BGO98_32990 [Myxococcales bacterium 68-20]